MFYVLVEIKGIVMEYLNYEYLTSKALLDVVKISLKQVEKQGFLYDHHFYITFKTDMNGVIIPNFLKAQYPNDLTIVLQYEFYDLKVNDDCFEVLLSFNGNPEKITVPFNSIIMFHDPSVNFALSFIPQENKKTEEKVEIKSKQNNTNNVENIDFEKNKNEQNKIVKTNNEDNIISFSNFKKDNNSYPDDIA